MRNVPSIIACLVLGAHILGMPSAMAGEVPGEVPEEVRMLEGSYTGAWNMFGINETGEIVTNMTWTDTVEAGESKVEGNRAFVTTVNVMTFEGGQNPPFRMQGREGYALNQDGSLGDYFIEVAGRTHRMVQVGDNVWSCTAPADAGELGRLGFPATATGQHVLVKVVTEEQGIETHRISRLTAVRWKNKDGKEQVMSFVSLKGHHLREQ